MFRFSSIDRPKFNAFHRDGSGASAVEFALVVPAILFILFGVAVLGIFLGLNHSLQQISADVSRYAMVGTDQEDRVALVAQSIRQSSANYPLIDSELLSYRVNDADGWMTVTVSYDTSGYRLPRIVREWLPAADRLERSATVVLP